MTKQPLGGPPGGRRVFEAELLELKLAVKVFARSLTGNETTADDLAQDTLTKALSSWEQYQPGTNLKAWLFMICRNRFYSEKRRSWRSTGLDQDFAERIRDFSPNQAELEEFRQEFCTIASLLGHLPGDMRDAVIATQYLGMSYEASAYVMQTEVGTMKSRVSRGLEQLRRLIEGGEKNVFDLTAWATASHAVPRDHPYFPIAKAYEEIYAALLLRPNCSRVTIRANAEPVKEKIDRAWEELLASGVMDENEDLDALMRHEDGSH